METAHTRQFDPRIQALWDRLSEFDASRHDEAFEFLLRSLCEMTGARNATWIGAVRLADIAPRDPLHGWRPRLVRFLYPTVVLDASVREQTMMLDDPSLAVDISVINNVAQSGRLRANLIADLVPREWFDGYYYRTFYLATGIKDAVWAGCPVNADSEVYIGLLRGVDDPPFEQAECDTIFAALRGLKWFMRQHLLSHGLLVASAPLTPVEREVLRGLLAAQTEKEIARAQDRGVHTVHQYVKALYRKFGVKNRAALMALWLGKMA